MAFLKSEEEAGRVAGVIGIGGSGNTALITPAMQALSVGLPKVMVSTIASGNAAPYVGISDIRSCIRLSTSPASMPSRAGARQRRASDGGHGRASRSLSAAKRTLGHDDVRRHDACVTRVREALEGPGFDCLVFHATGTGGQAMEKLVEAGLIQGVLDITTTEVADQVVGGTLPAGRRFDAILQARVPYVLSLGALDMVNFGGDRHRARAISRSGSSTSITPR